MPNWCMNTVTFTGPRHKLDQLEQATVKDTLLEFMVPVNKTSENWFQIQVNAWGTKWDISDGEVADSSDELVVSFNTAWSPPESAFRTWAEHNTDCTFSMIYFEPGVGFAGELSWDGECFSEESLESTDLGYKQYIEDQFGWVDYDEEPEPLTEWYTQGVKDNGLDESDSVQIAFAPGAFDNFEGTQQELDELVTELHRMARSGELTNNSKAVDLDELLETDPDLAEKILRSLDTTINKDLQ